MYLAKDAAAVMDDATETITAEVDNSSPDSVDTPADRARSADPEIVEALQRVIVAGVALTASTLARSGSSPDLTFPQWRVLVVLGEQPEGRSVRQISRLIGVTLPATGRQLRRLEGRGLLTLQPDLLDRRVTRARLSDEGAARLAAIIADRRTRIAEAIAAIEPEHDLAGTLSRLANSLEQR